VRPALPTTVRPGLLLGLGAHGGARHGRLSAMDVDLAVVGAGGAGLSLFVHLDHRWPAGRRPPSIALVDPVRRQGDDRTWCFWTAADDDPVGGPLAAAVHRSWRRVELVDVDGRSRVLDLGPLRYVMIRSGEFYALAEKAVARLRAVRVPAGADAVGTGLVRAGGTDVSARWILDSRPAPPRRPATTALLQHFRGWTVRFARSPGGPGGPGSPGGHRLDPDVPVLMDFSVPQPAHGVAFGYVLPSSDRRALVEYTEFSRQRLPDAAYEGALAGYLRQRFDVGPGDYVVEHVEDGAIPMTDAVHARRAGPGVFRIGTAGGATRGSTGYAFAAMQRQAVGLADALIAGREPLPPLAYPSRHRWLDAVMLRALDRGITPGPQLFVRLFERNPPERVLRFLDGTTGPADELRVMASAPMAPMLRAGAGDALARLARRRSR